FQVRTRSANVTPAMQFPSILAAMHLPLKTPTRPKTSAESTVPQVRAPVLGANLGDTLPRFERGVGSSHATRSAAISGLRRIPFCNLQLLSSPALRCICRTHSYKLL